MNATLLEGSYIPSLLDSVDTFLFDCDGVLWNGATVIPGGAETVKKMRILGKKIFFVTNNSTRTRAVYVQKLKKMGIEASEEEVIGSAYVAAQYLKHDVKFSGKVYMIGLAGLREELQAEGYTVIEDDGGVVESDIPNLGYLPLDPEVGCVVIGFDHYFNFLKLTRATQYLQDPKCHFVVTNTDATFPTGGKTIPGSGAPVAALLTASGRTADVICGKPYEAMFKLLQEQHHLDPSKTLMIGDRLETDIMFANNNGLRSLAVLSGIVSLEEIQQKQRSNSLEDQKQIPEFYITSVKELGQGIS